MIICVLVSMSCAQEADVKSAPCDISTTDDNNLTLNCSRRSLNYIPEWPAQIDDIIKGESYYALYRKGVITSMQVPAYIMRDTPNKQLKFFRKLPRCVIANNALYL